jgi:hypothetical protein
MRICFDLAHVFHPGASDEDNALALRVLLEALIANNRLYLQATRNVPPLYRSGVVYARTKIWDSTPDLFARQYGDCKSLTATFVAQEREAGRVSLPVFRFMPNPQSGQKDFHILVQQGATFHDPSRVLGMEQYHAQRGLWVFPQ